MNIHEIIDGFVNTLPEKPGLVVVHSSLMALRVDPHLFKWEFLKAITTLVGQGYSFSFPAFTFSFCGSGHFDVLRSKSEVGILADWVMELYDSTRTNHPIYSHVFIGALAQRAHDYSVESCFGQNSIFAFFEEENATISMLGCGWRYCTLFHFFEEKVNVPYRYYKTFEGKNTPEQKATMYVRDLSINPINDFSPAIRSLYEKGEIAVFNIDGYRIESTACNSLGAISLELLFADPYCFVKNPITIKNRVDMAVESRENEEVRVAILANSNFEHLGAIFKEDFCKFLPFRRLKFYQNAYNQMSADIIGGKLKKFTPDFCFLPSRLEDIYGVDDLEFADIADVSLIENYFLLIKNVDALVQKKGFVHLFPQVTSSSQGAALIDHNRHLHAFISEANQKIIDLVKGLENIELISPEMMTRSSLFSDPRLWALGKIPYSLDVFHDFSKTYCGCILYDLGKTVRLLVIDLDNTLWGGVLGEDGIDGISLGGDFPGNAFKEFQKTILQLNKRGIAIALASKNDENIAFNCIENHPEMIIKQKHLAAYKINWKEKYLNIREIAKEVSLGYESIMFVDDNPIEREKVSVNIPGVIVLELPQDPSLYRQALIESPFLSVTEITEEDKKRSKSYFKKRILSEEINKFESIEDFLFDLQIKIKFNKLNEFNFSRCLQLITKTNQFNCTSKRYTEKMLKRMQNDEDIFIGIVEYSDKLTDPENIGVFILQKAERDIIIDTFLLSCRVLGRSIEDAVIAWVASYTFCHGFENLVGQVIETPRNTPVRNLYKDRGFTLDASGMWRWPVSKKIECPPYIQIEENQNRTL